VCPSRHRHLVPGRASRWPRDAGPTSRAGRPQWCRTRPRAAGPARAYPRGRNAAAPAHRCRLRRCGRGGSRRPTRGCSSRPDGRSASRPPHRVPRDAAHGSRPASPPVLDAVEPLVLVLEARRSALSTRRRSAAGKPTSTSQLWPP
jgi:hypothetical protein